MRTTIPFNLDWRFHLGEALKAGSTPAYQTLF